MKSPANLNKSTIFVEVNVVNLGLPCAKMIKELTIYFLRDKIKNWVVILYASVQHKFALLLSCKECFSEMHDTHLLIQSFRGSREVTLLCSYQRDTKILRTIGILRSTVSRIFISFQFLFSAVTEFEVPFFQMSVKITVKILKIASLILLLAGIALYFNIGTHLYQKEHRQNRNIGKWILSRWFCN